MLKPPGWSPGGSAGVGAGRWASRIALEFRVALACRVTRLPLVRFHLWGGWPGLAALVSRCGARPFGAHRKPVLSKTVTMNGGR